MALHTRFGCALLLVALSAGCATTGKAPASAADGTLRYQAGITYSMSAAMLAQLAAAGQDVKLTINLQSGVPNGVANCTVQPVAPFAARPSLTASSDNRIW
jgi:hypothetical protein